MTSAEAKVILDLLDEAYGLRRRDAEGMLSTATLALELCQSRAGESPELHDLQGLCFAHIGNAQRILGKLREARSSFTEAVASIKRGSPSASFLATTLRFRASLEESQGQSRDALLSLREAARLFADSGDAEGVAACRVKAAIVLAYSGESRTAFDEVLGALPAIQDEDLLRSAWTVGIRALCDAGRPDAGMILLQLGRNLLQRGGPLSQLKVEWLEAQLRRECGLDAADQFATVRRQYSERKMAIPASLLALEEAVCHLRFGRPMDACGLLEEASPILKEAGLTPEYLASRIVVEKSLSGVEAALAGALRRARLLYWRST